jgi:SpoVK/Ycf46/Vps4 family AAA+-type ATPase
MTDLARLEGLLRSRRPLITIRTFEEDYALGLVRNAALNLGRACWLWSLTTGVRDGLLANAAPIPDTTDPAAALALLGERERTPLLVALDLGAHLREPRVLRAVRNTLSQFAASGAQLVLIDAADNLPDVLRAQAAAFDVSLPGDAEIEQLVRGVLRAEHQQRPLHIDISRSGWTTILRNLRGLTRRQVDQIVRDLVAEDRRLDETDINHLLARKRQALQSDGLLEYVEAPVSLDEIGGMARLKHWLAQRRGALDEKAVEFGLPPPRGVLMLGVQGAGKSLCAKAVAAAWQRPLLRLDAGALYDRYVGESERRLRSALQQAEQMAPLILWIDEIEKAFASAASQSTDGGLSKRMFGALLTWMQEHDKPVFLIATANDIEALPPELLRKGRFDEIFFVDLPAAAARAQILAIHLRKRGRDPAQFDLDALTAASEGFSGAEIEQAIVAALYQAFEKRSGLDTAGVLQALQDSPPLSVTMAERIAALRQWARGRCVPAD